MPSTDPITERVWCHWIYRIGGWAVCAYFYVTLATDSFTAPPANTWPPLLVNVLVAVLASRGLAFPEVRTRRDEVVVQGALHTWWIPYSQVASVKMGSTLVIDTTAGEEIGAIAFQSSLVGLLTGEKKANRLVAIIAEQASSADTSLEGARAKRSVAPALRQTVWVIGVYVLTYAVVVALASSS